MATKYSPEFDLPDIDKLECHCIIRRNRAGIARECDNAMKRDCMQCRVYAAWKKVIDRQIAKEKGDT